MKNLSAKDTKIERKSTIRVGGRIIDISSPHIFGIVNLTPDSFFDGGTLHSEEDVLAKVSKMIENGADGIDLGAQSTRPKAEQIGAEAEWTRLKNALIRIRKEHPNTLISIDTYHSSVAERAADCGADIINDISGGTFDTNMFETVAKLKLPYVLMHIQGNVETMQVNPNYTHVVEEIVANLATKTRQLMELGVNDVLIDPGFGFGKTVEQNFEILRNLDYFHELGHPLFVGLSRKSMIWKSLNSSPSEALNGTTALNMIALEAGAHILRVHDVQAAMETRTLWRQLNKSK
ncbi:MAG: dihydropteroate synthase [Bacteroidetes bacterium]|nr:MAG: dihydropteroate synthase [Bacteroidota bacterium]